MHSREQEYFSRVVDHMRFASAIVELVIELDDNGAGISPNDKRLSDAIDAVSYHASCVMQSSPIYRS